MTKGERYRAKAAEIAAQARVQTNLAMRTQLEALERSYLRLAAQADKNAGADIVYETPTPRPSAQPQQQQQQVQPAKKEPER